MIQPPVRRDTIRINSSRALFINGQVVKGNLKPKRTRRRSEIFRRIVSRFEVNQILVEQRPTTKERE